MRSRVLRPNGPVDLAGTLFPLRRGIGDPCMRIGPAEAWRAWRTPDGPATLRLRTGAGEIVAHAWGPGTEAALEAAPGLAGLEDHPELLVPVHQAVRELQRRLPGLRLTRTSTVLDVLVPAVMEQKIVGKEARRIHRAVVLALGEPAPGPAGLHLPPERSTLAATPYYAFHPFGLERRRAEVIRSAASRADRLEALSSARDPVAWAAARRALRSLPGVGAWTAAEVARLALGDPDAVSVGDYHLPHLVSWLLAGEPRGTDERMLELLEPYRGQRGRVQRLLEASGIVAPRFGPRQPVRSIARL
jgi:3-methyladenine DNA glycosylase/8-oxoguanine DNA glycosylase